MRKNYCNLCCKEISDRPALISEKKAYLEAHRKGRFNLEYARAVVNGNDEVTHFSADYQFALCGECQDRIEKVIWAEVEKMNAEIAGKEISHTFVAPQFPAVPEVEESSYPIPPYTNG